MNDALSGMILAVLLCLYLGRTEAIKKDIVFLVDTSGSIDTTDVLQAVDFIYNVTKWLTIGPDNIRVSVVTFDVSYDEKLKLKDYNSRAELLQNLKRKAYSQPGGGTKTDVALEFVRLNSFLPDNGGRHNANKTVVLLTDGQSSFPNETLTQAGLLKSVPKTEIFTIGIGSAVSKSNEEIRGISSDPDSYYVQQVDAYLYLCNVVPALVPKLDPLSNATNILNCPTPTATTRNPSSGHLGWRSSTTGHQGWRLSTTGRPGWRSSKSDHLGWRPSTAIPVSGYHGIGITRTTSHQQAEAMSSAERMSSRDVKDDHTKGEVDIALIVGAVLAGLAVSAAIGGAVIWWKRASQVSPSRAVGQSDVPWTRQYNETREGQLNTKFNPASLR